MNGKVQPMTKGRLIELLKDVPDDVAINVLNDDGELTANIEFWFENLETRKFVELIGRKPFWRMWEDGEVNENYFE